MPPILAPKLLLPALCWPVLFWPMLAGRRDDDGGEDADGCACQETWAGLGWASPLERHDPGEGRSPLDGRPAYGPATGEADARWAGTWCSAGSGDDDGEGVTNVADESWRAMLKAADAGENVGTAACWCWCWCWCCW
ncbi:hypothetical protein BC831DRAFT_453484 [Entophlyctis helioformis]|nr:hypothetical protein BC831DRAFT_453484 [Entophlyctis helioformis]